MIVSLIADRQSYAPGVQVVLSVDNGIRYFRLTRLFAVNPAPSARRFAASGLTARRGQAWG